MEFLRGKVSTHFVKLDLDGIYPRIFKELRCEIADHLTKICNLTYFPEDWKVADVMQIFKKAPGLGVGGD